MSLEPINLQEIKKELEKGNAGYMSAQILEYIVFLETKNTTMHNGLAKILLLDPNSSP